jgi:hypothetical protein
MKILLCLACVLLLTLCAMGQSGVPSLCKPCLFYGGDFDEDDINSASLPDENTGSYPETSTYGVVNIPPFHSVLVQGILFQIQFDGTVKFDPNGVTWEVRTGVSEGNEGILVASGQSFAFMQPTGRGGNGAEYTVAVKLPQPLGLSGNTSYFFNITPICLNKHDVQCATNQYGVSNTTHQTNSYRGILQPTHAMMVNSKAFGWNWRNWCDLINQDACANLSFGLIGRVLQ